jgi:Zn-finger protein
VRFSTLTLTLFYKEKDNMIKLETSNYKFNQHRTCEFFPCHKGVEEEKFNCLFCYCPLYMLENECGGNYKITNGVKDCSACTKPHNENSYDFIMSKMNTVIKKGSSFITK